MNKQRILRNFSQQTQTYDSHAYIQAHAAHQLADLLRPKGQANSILEIGCGTGLLTKHLSQWNPDLYLVSDISRAMVHHCQKHTPHNNFLVMDGELLALDCTFDLIASNFTFQWFSHIESSLLELLSYTRCLAFSVPGPQTFHEWTELCKTHHIRSGVQRFLTIEDYQRIFSHYHIRHLSNDYLTLTFDHWLQFWQSVKGIGGHTPRDEHAPQNLKALKSILTSRKATITYDIIYCIVER